MKLMVSKFLSIVLLILIVFSVSVIPTLILTPTVEATDTSGEIFLWVQFWLVDGNGNPNAQAQRIANAKSTYGRPEWVEAGNWGSSHLGSGLINYFHSVGIKVSCRLWSGYSEVPLETLKHDMNVANGYGGSVDYQLSIGSEIDMIMIDQCAQWNIEYYSDLADYVHSKGKLFAVNVGGWDISSEICQIADKVSVEFDWRNFIANKQSLIAQYPQKFIGISNDWGYQYYPPYYTVDLNRAIADTLEAWNGGVYYFESREGDGTYLPDWWEDYLDSLGGEEPTFVDGFENGNFSTWTGINGNPTVQNITKHHGTYGAYFNANDEYCYKTISGQNIAYCRAYIYFNTLAGTDGRSYKFFGLNDGSGDYYVYVGILDNVFFLSTCEAGNVVDVSSGVTASATTWYCIEVLRDITNDHAELWIDNVSRATRDSSFTQQSAECVLGIGYGSGSPTFDMYADCVVVDTTYIGLELNFHDVAVTNVTPNKNIVGQNFTIRVNVTVMNEGDFTETFNVTLYANTTSVASQEVTLTSRNSTTITFTWNTTGFTYGNYTLSATATPVPGETDTTGNTHIDGTVFVTIPGDVNGDRIVDGADLSLLGKAYRSTPGDPDWNAACDINGDDIVDGADLSIAGHNYRESIW